MYFMYNRVKWEVRLPIRPIMRKYQKDGAFQQLGRCLTFKQERTYLRMTYMSVRKISPMHVMEETV